MIRPTRVLLCAAVAAHAFAVGAFAQSATCGLEGTLMNLHRGADRVIFDPDRPAVTDLLFLALPPSLSFEPGEQLRLELSVAGEPLLVETLELALPSRPEVDRALSRSAKGLARLGGDEAEISAEIPGTVIELLSRNEEERSYLHRLAQEREIEIVGFLRGEEVLRVGFSELLEVDAGNGNHSLAVPVLSKIEVGQLSPDDQVEAAEWPPQTKASQSCLWACDDEYWDCVAYRCNYTQCAYCQDQQTSCYAACGSCTATSTTVSETVLFSRTAVPGVHRKCFRLFPPYGTTVEWTKYRYKTTTTRIDQHTDCSVSQTIVSITYSDTFCFRPLGIACGGADPISGLCH